MPRYELGKLNKAILKDGHTMFPEDVIRDIERLQRKIETIQNADAEWADEVMEELKSKDKTISNLSEALERLTRDEIRSYESGDTYIPRHCPADVNEPKKEGVNNA